MQLHDTRNRIIKWKVAVVAATFTFMLALLLVSPSPASAQGETDRVAIGSDLVIGEDEVVQGDVSVTNGNLILLGEVRGNVAVFNGNVTVSGKVGGDVAVTTGSLTLDARCEIKGNVLMIMGTLTRNPSARVGGEVTSLDNRMLNIGSVAAPQPGPPVGKEIPTFVSKAVGRFTGMLTWTMFTLLMLSLGVGLAFLVPGRVLVSSRTLEAEVGPSLVVGAITALLLGPIAGFVVMLLIASMVGVAFIPLVVLAVVALLLCGLVVVSVWLGKRVYETARPDVEQGAAPLPVQVLIGMAVILGSTAVPSVLAPGWTSTLLLPLLYFVSCIGLGSAILSRLGTIEPRNMARNLPPAL